jgi:hypothetical protein
MKSIFCNTRQAEFFENYFDLQGCVKPADFFADCFIVADDPVFDGAVGNAINGSKFCKTVGFNVDCFCNGTH